MPKLSVLQLCHRQSCSPDRFKVLQNLEYQHDWLHIFQLNIQPKSLINLCIQPNLLTSCQSCVCFSSAVDKVVVRTIRLLSRQQPAKSGIHYQVYWGGYQHTNYFSESSECVHFSKYQIQTINHFLVLSRHFFIFCMIHSRNERLFEKF